MAQLYVAHYLEELLQFWEDCNLAGEFNFQFSLSNKLRKSVPFDEKYDAKVGTELSNIGILARAIPEYKNLRKVLMGHSMHHATGFMPRIPKDIRELVGEYENLFYYHFFVKSPVLIPKFILRWNETKRACILTDNVPVPLLNLSKENWFHCLPYESFFLKLSTPFFFPDNEFNNGGWHMDSFLIYKDEEFIKILSWPQEIERCMFSPEERRDISKEIELIKKGKKPKESIVQGVTKVHDWFLVTIAIKSGTSMVLNPNLDENGISAEYVDLYDKDFWSKQYKEVDNYNRIKIKLETINGFCKLMSSLPAKSSVVKTIVTESRPVPALPHQWFELPLQYVDYYHTEQNDKEIIVKTGSGYEKSPHVRRAHQRRLVKKDGTVEVVWIDQMVIREDKLTTEQLQGGALKID